MRAGTVAAALALAALAGCSVQPATLRIGPQQDVTVTYGRPAGESGDGAVLDGGIARVRMWAGCAAERVEPAGAAPGPVLILDQASGRAFHLLAGRQAYAEAEIPAASRGGSLLCRGPAGQDRFKRLGQERQRIAGQLCTLWTRHPHDLQDFASAATLCVTAQGVILSYQSGRMDVRATEVAIAPLDAALFRPPPGHVRVPMPPRPPAEGRTRPD